MDWICLAQDRDRWREGCCEHGNESVVGIAWLLIRSNRMSLNRGQNWSAESYTEMPMNSPPWLISPQSLNTDLRFMWHSVMYHRAPFPFPPSHAEGRCYSPHSKFRNCLWSGRGNSWQGLHYSMWTGSGAHPDPYPVRTSGSFAEGKADLQLVPRLKTCGSIHPLPHTPSWRST
jgi:hypothetical protein